MIQELDKNLNTTLMQTIQQQRVIWQMAKASGGAIEIDQLSCPPLWNLRFEDVKEKKDHLRIIADLLPEPTEIQLEHLAQLLLGKRVHPGELTEQCGLGEYPTTYVIRALGPKVVLHEGTWISRADYDKIPKQEPPTSPQPPKENAV